MEAQNRQRGFTLIEVVTVVLIVGIITTVSGMAVVTAMRGYLFARDNLAIGQKAQLALARINRELTELTTVTTAESDRITYQRWEGGDIVSFTIYRDEDDETIKIASGVDPQNGDTLVDNITAFELNYYKEDNGSPWGAQWTGGTDPVDELTVIDISLDIERTEDSRSVSFTAMVYPRNIGRF